MIRPTIPNDTTALIALADATGLFQPNQLEELGEMLSDYFGGINDSHSLRDGKAERFWITDDDNGAVGVAYCEMERMKAFGVELPLPLRYRFGSESAIAHTS